MGCELCGGGEEQYCANCKPDYIKDQVYKYLYYTYGRERAITIDSVREFLLELDDIPLEYFKKLIDNEIRTRKESDKTIKECIMLEDLYLLSTKEDL